MIGEQEIRTRSYLLWEAEGRPTGRDIEFWLRAELELKAELRGASKGIQFVMPRVPISDPPRRRSAMRVEPRSGRVTAAPSTGPIAASI